MVGHDGLQLDATAPRYCTPAPPASANASCRRVPRRPRTADPAPELRALRPAARPNASASVMALPDSRLAPLAPPTASPAANSPGTPVAIVRVHPDARPCGNARSARPPRHPGQIDAVAAASRSITGPKAARSDRVRQLRESSATPRRAGEPRPAATSLVMA